MVRVDGVVTHVRVDGCGPPVVLSGGLGSGWFDWSDVTALLAPHHTVVRFDRPGLGLSAPQRRPPELTAEADRIVAVLDAVSVRGPVTVVGHSLAGLHAEACARRHPRRVRALVLADATQAEPAPAVRLSPGAAGGAARLLAGAVSAAGLPRALGPVLRNLTVRAGTVRGTAGPGRTDAGRAEAGRADAALREAALRSDVRRGYRTSRVAHAVLAEWATYPHLRAELSALRALRPLPAGLPVTILAAYDARESAAGLRWLRQQRALAALLDGTFRVAAPSGHLLMLDAPEALARAARRA